MHIDISRSQATSEANPADPKGCLKLAVATARQRRACSRIRLELDGRLTLSRTSIVMSSISSAQNLIYSWADGNHESERCACLQADWVV